MISYSQSGEDLIALRYFNKKGITGAVLELGANDGTTFSNSRLLIENGWDAYLVEPSSVFEKLFESHRHNKKVKCIEVAVGIENGTIDFYESGAHVPGGTDECLVSTTDPEEMKRWPDVSFIKREVSVMDFKTLVDMYVDSGQPIDLISIDVEGMDWAILQQIDLNEVGCKMLIIEWNSAPWLESLYTNHCASFGLYEIHRNAENLIFALHV